MAPNIWELKRSIDKAKTVQEDLISLLKKALPLKGKASKDNKIALKSMMTFVESASDAFDYIVNIAASHEQALSSTTEMMLATIQEKLKETQTKRNTSPSFADIMHEQSKQNSSNFSNIPPKNTTKTIFVATKDANQVSGPAIQQNFKAKFDNRKRKIKIKKTFNTSKGIGIVCEPDDKPINEIIQMIRNDIDPSNSTCTIQPQKARMPTLVVTGVSKDTDLSTFKESLLDQNDLPAGSIQHSFALNSKRQSPTADIVIRVTPEAFQEIARRDFKLFIGHQQCFLRRKVLVDQCQCCLGFGHSTKNCNKKNNDPICLKCGKQEAGHNCEHTSPHKCHNCSKHAYFKTLPHAHLPNNPNCPIYNRRHQQLEAQTDYHPFPQ